MRGKTKDQGRRTFKQKPKKFVKTINHTCRLIFAPKRLSDSQHFMPSTGKAVTKGIPGVSECLSSIPYLKKILLSFRRDVNVYDPVPPSMPESLSRRKRSQLKPHSSPPPTRIIFLMKISKNPINPSPVRNQS